MIEPITSIDYVAKNQKKEDDNYTEVRRRKRTIVFSALCLIATCVLVRVLLIIHVVQKFAKMALKYSEFTYKMNNFETIDFRIDCPFVYAPLNMTLSDVKASVYEGKKPDEQNRMVNLTLSEPFVIAKYSRMKMSNTIIMQDWGKEAILRAICKRGKILINISLTVTCRFCWMSWHCSKVHPVEYDLAKKNQSIDKHKDNPLFWINECNLELREDDLVAKLTIEQSKDLFDHLGTKLNVKTNPMSCNLVCDNISLSILAGEIDINKSLLLNPIEITISTPKAKIAETICCAIEIAFSKYKSREVCLYFSTDIKSKIKSFDMKFSTDMLNRPADSYSDALESARRVCAITAFKIFGENNISCIITPNLSVLGCFAPGVNVSNNFNERVFVVKLRNTYKFTFTVQQGNVLNFCVTACMHDFDIVGLSKNASNIVEIYMEGWKETSSSTSKEELIDNSRGWIIKIADKSVVLEWDSENEDRIIALDHNIYSDEFTINIFSALQITKQNKGTLNGYYVYVELPRIELDVNLNDIMQASFCVEQNTYKLGIDGCLTEKVYIKTTVENKNSKHFFDFNSKHFILSFTAFDTKNDCIKFKLDINVVPSESADDNKKQEQKDDNKMQEQKDGSKMQWQNFEKYLQNLQWKQTKLEEKGSISFNLSKAIQQKFKSKILVDNKVTIHDRICLKVWPVNYQVDDLYYDLEIIENVSAIIRLDLCAMFQSKDDNTTNEHNETVDSGQHDVDDDKNFDFGIGNLDFNVNLRDYARYFELMNKPFFIVSNYNYISRLIATYITELTLNPMSPNEDSTTNEQKFSTDGFEIHCSVDHSGSMKNLWTNFSITLKATEEMLQGFKYGSVKLKNNRLVARSKDDKSSELFRAECSTSVESNWKVLRLSVGFAAGKFMLNDTFGEQRFACLKLICTDTNKVEWTKKCTISAFDSFVKCFLENLHKRNNVDWTEVSSNKCASLGSNKCASLEKVALNVLDFNPSDRSFHVTRCGRHAGIRFTAEVVTAESYKFIRDITNQCLDVFFDTLPGQCRLVIESEKICIWEGLDHIDINSTPDQSFDIWLQNLHIDVFVPLTTTEDYDEEELYKISGQCYVGIPGQVYKKTNLGNLRFPLIDLVKPLFESANEDGDDEKSESNGIMAWISKHIGWEPASVHIKTEAEITILPKSIVNILIGLDERSLVEGQLYLYQDDKKKFWLILKDLPLENYLHILHKLQENRGQDFWIEAIVAGDSKLKVYMTEWCESQKKLVNGIFYIILDAIKYYVKKFLEILVFLIHQLCIGIFKLCQIFWGESYGIADYEDSFLAAILL